MGRPAKPAQLKLLEGRGRGRDSGGRPVALPPAFERCEPEPPPSLSQDGRRLWDETVPSLVRLNLIKAEDGPALACYCEAWSAYVEATALWRAEGMVLVNPDSGRRHVHPAFNAARALAAEMLRYATQFGLTPVAEQRLGGAAPEVDDADNPFAWGGNPFGRAD